MNHLALKKMAIAAILLAFIFAFAFTPLGFIKIGVIDITTLMIPVAIGACVLGWKYGMFLGCMFGLVSYLQALWGISPFGEVLMGIDPVATFVICFVPRILMGLCTALLFRAVQRVDKTKFVSYIVGSISGALFNTVFFVTAFLIFFRNANLEAFSMDLSKMSIGAIIVALVALNGVLEIVFCGLIGTAIAKPLSKVVDEKNNY